MNENAHGSQRPPNLVFLMTDHQRFDSLGMRQAGAEVTPNLNRLAAESTSFERAYTTCPLCVPARTALATGLYPTRNGVVLNDWAGDSGGDHKPLHQHLEEAGYSVAHVGVDHIRVSPGLRDRVDFDLWRDPRDHALYLDKRGLDASPPEGMQRFKRTITIGSGEEESVRHYSNVRTARWRHGAEHFLDNYLAGEAVSFVRAAHQGPFALFLYLWAPHPPLRVPAPYDSMFPPEDIDLPANVGRPAAEEPPGRRRALAARIAEGVDLAQWRRVWAAHLGLTRLADDALGTVLETLEEEGHADDTITLFTVDHGEHLGQHGMYQKMEMYEPALHVPLLMRTPGGCSARLQTPVSHLDVMPTLLDLLGLEPAVELDGTSLRDCIQEGTEPPTRTIFSQFSGNSRIEFIRRAAISGRYKYVYAPGEGRELFDLEEDPLEMKNLAGSGQHRQTLQKLHAACAAWAREHGDWVEF